VEQVAMPPKARLLTAVPVMGATSQFSIRALTKFQFLGFFVWRGEKFKLLMITERNVKILSVLL
jgi:hypothetical protein